MLAKKHRLNLSREENSLIFKKGESQLFSSDFLLAYIRKNTQDLRVACISPKTIFKTASARNYYRRLLYSFCEEEIAKNNINLSTKNDLVIVIKKNFSKEKVNKEALKKDFLRLMKKVNEKNI